MCQWFCSKKNWQAEMENSGVFVFVFDGKRVFHTQSFS